MPVSKNEIRMLIDGKWQTVNLQQFCHLSGMSKYDAEKALNKMLVGETGKTELGYHFQVANRTFHLTEAEQRARENKLSNFERQINEMEKAGKFEVAEKIKATRDKYLAEIELKNQQMEVEQDLQQTAFNGSKPSDYKSFNEYVKEVLEKNRQELEALRQEQAEYEKSKSEPKEETLTQEEEKVLKEAKEELSQKMDAEWLSNLINNAVEKTMAELGISGGEDS